MTQAWLGFGLACIWQLLPLTAAAQTVTGAARVTTLVDACVPIALDQFQRVLAIELGTSIEFSPEAAQEPDGTVVRVGCAGAGIELQLHDNVTRKSMLRSVELPQVAVATRTRLLALAVAEFVVASWMELQLATPPPIEPLGARPGPEATAQATQLTSTRLPPPPAAPKPIAAPESLAPRWLIGISLEPVLFQKTPGLMGQLSVHAQQRPSRHLALTLNGSVAYGAWSVSDAIGEVKVKLTSTSGRLAAGYVAEAGMLELLAGAGVRIGVAHFAGESLHSQLRAEEFFAPWAGPCLQLSAALHGQHLRVGLELELGYVTLPVKALSDTRVVAELAGPWGATSLVGAWLF